LEIKEGRAISGGEYILPGGETSQYITGLLFALPLCPSDSRIVVTHPFESASYVALTIEALSKFGISADTKKEDGRTVFEIRGGQKYTATDASVEGDASNAAFFEALNLLGGEVEISGLNPHSLQGDSVFGAHFENLRNGGKAPIDLSDCPDLAPILFAMAAHFGYGEFTHTERLRLKESDRVAASVSELSKFGACFEEYPNALIVKGGNLHTPPEALSSHNDHRIAMSLSVLCTHYGGTVEDAGAVAKSMPDFFERLGELGVSIRINKS
jgi:3-phosphoshikimate 1-carboxyvinyltransferase